MPSIAWPIGESMVRGNVVAVQDTEVRTLCRSIPTDETAARGPGTSLLDTVRPELRSWPLRFDA
jgi:hypothetical protein